MSKEMCGFVIIFLGSWNRWWSLKKKKRFVVYYVLLFYIVHVYCVIYKKSFSLTVSLSLWGQPALSLAVESNNNKTKICSRERPRLLIVTWHSAFCSYGSAVELMWCCFWCMWRGTQRARVLHRGLKCSLILWCFSISLHLIRLGF